MHGHDSRDKMSRNILATISNMICLSDPVLILLVDTYKLKY